MEKRTLTIFFHILGSILFLLLPLVISHHSIFSEELVETKYFVNGVITFGLILGFFYFNFFFLLDGYFFKKKYSTYFLFVILCLILTTLVPSYILLHAFRFEYYLFVFSTVLFASFSWKINQRYHFLQKEKVNSELAFLKAQINPHFLFNTLNSIYSLTIEKSDFAPEAIVKLSGMMRYVISETAQTFVSLAKEMNYINSYIDLQKIRLGETAIVNYSFDGSTKDKVIAPLVLIPFIENAFKHGVNPEETSQIDIQISVSETNIYLHVFNLKVPHLIDSESRTGFGLENGKTQLQLLYPNKHELKLENTPFSFTVTLNLEII